MLRVGQKEVEAIARVILSGKLFRYHLGRECRRFEKRFARYIGSGYCTMTSSGTTALTAALAGLGIGPGDEVVVPACTYMATAVAVVAVGAIPVIADVDESITLDPDALDDAVGPHTRAVIPVHMWGLPCNLERIMRVARRRKLLVIEDVAQAVGGAYEGRKLGSFGHAAGFSFNYYKHITCGEGGAVVTNNRQVADRALCMTDCCNFYWTGRKKDMVPFMNAGARASEIEGAMLNAQLDRLDGMIAAMRRHKQRVLRETVGMGLTPVKANSPEWECGSYAMYLLPTEEQAARFARLVGGTVAGKTGRHVYTEWDPLFAHRGSHHPALNPFTLPENRRCRTRYTPTMCSRSLHILNRTVMVGMLPDRSGEALSQLIRQIRCAAQKVLKPAPA